MVLVPVGGSADLICADKGIYMLGPYDFFEAVRGRQYPDKASQNRKAQEIVQTSRRRHPALRGRAAP